MKYFTSHTKASFPLFGIALVVIGVAVGMSFHPAPAQSVVKEPTLVQAPQKASTADPKVESKQPAKNEEPTKPGQGKADRGLSPSSSNRDPGKPTPDMIMGAVTIRSLDRPELLLVPVDPTKSRAEQTEWWYIPVFHIEKVNYVSEKKILTCQIDPRLSVQFEDRICARLRELTKAPLQTAFQLNPVRLQSLTVELSVDDEKKFVLRSVQSGHDIASGPLPVLYRVKDEELQELLKTNLSNLTITIRSKHPYSWFTKNYLRIDLSTTAVREAIEKVLPRSMKPEDLEKHPLIVDRDSLLQLQQVLREEFRVRSQGDTVNLAGLDKVLEKVLNRITVSQVPLHEVTPNMIDNFLIWDTKTARLDVSQNVRETMTNALTEATEKRKKLEEAWNFMSEEANKAGDAETWHNTLYDKSKTQGEVSVGISIFNASGSLNVEKEFSKSDEGSKLKSREFYDKLKKGSEKIEETLDKTFRDFKGVDFARSVAGKILNLQRVTDLNVLSFRTALFEHDNLIRTGMLEHVTFLPLETSNTIQADALRQIDLLREELLRNMKENTRQAALDRVPIGAMIPYFGAGKDSPKGYVWADGTTIWPDKDFVPTHLRGKKVPDMQGELLGGANSELEVGQLWTRGRLSFTINGDNFTLPKGEEVSLIVKKNAVIWESGGRRRIQTCSHETDMIVREEDITTKYLNYSGHVQGTQSVSLDMPEKTRILVTSCAAGSSPLSRLSATDSDLSFMPLLPRRKRWFHWVSRRSRFSSPMTS